MAKEQSAEDQLVAAFARYCKVKAAEADLRTTEPAQRFAFSLLCDYFSYSEAREGLALYEEFFERKWGHKPEAPTGDKPEGA